MKIQIPFSFPQTTDRFILRPALRALLPESSMRHFTVMMRMLMVFVLALGFTGGVMGQSSANYTFATAATGSLGLDMNGNALDMSSGATSLLPSSTDDTRSSLTNIGFEFWMMGSRVTNFSCTENGIVELGGNTVATNAYLISANTTLKLLAPFANDLRVGTDGVVQYKLFGTAPNRALVIEYKNIMIRYMASAAPGTGTWQVRLYENTGIIEYMYGAMATNSATQSPVNVGFGINTTANNFVTINTSHVSNTSGAFETFTPTASSTVTHLHSSSEGTRRYYRFTPPGSAGHMTITSLASPTSPLTFSAISSSGMTLNWSAASPTTGILKYAVYNSTDGGTTYNFVNTTNLGTNTLAVTGLTPGTTYDWKVVSISEGALSAGITGTQATSPPATYYWIGISGADWNTGGNWNTSADGMGSSRSVVSTTDILIIDGMGTTAGLAGTVSMSASQSIGSLQITNSTAVTLQSSAATQRVLTLTGSVGDEFSIGAGSSILLTNTSNIISIIFSTGTGMTGTIAGTLTVSGATTSATTSNSFLTTGGTGTVVTVTSTGVINNTATSNISTNGNVTGSTSSLVFSNGSSYNVSGATTGAPWIPLATWGASSTVTISGLTTSSSAPTNAVQSFGNLTWNCPGASSGTFNFWGSNSVTLQGNLTIQATGGTQKFRCVSSGTLNVLGSVTVSGSSACDISSSSGTVNVTGTFTHSSSGTTIIGASGAGTLTCSSFSVSAGTVDLASSSSSSSLKVSGTFNQTGGTITESSSSTASTIEFNGSSAQSVTLGTISNTINYRINNNAGINLTGTMAITTGASLRISSTAAAPITGGTLTYTGTTTLVYDAVGNQTTTSNEWLASSGPTNITINNTGLAGTANRVSLHAARTITGTLTMTSGVFQLGNNDLTMTGTISGAASNTNFIATNGTGQLKQTYTTTGSKTFPLGDATSPDEASAVVLNYSALTGTSVVGVRVTDGQHPSDGSGSNYLSRYYSFTESGAASGTFSLTVNYQAGDVVGTPGSTRVNKWDGASWSLVAGTVPGATSVALTGLSYTLLGGGTSDFTLRPAAVAVYTWVGGTAAAYNAPASWSPSRGSADASDVLQFDGSNIDGVGGTGAITATAVPTEGIGRMVLLNNVEVTLQSGSAANTLTINGGTGTDLDIPVGSKLTINGTNTMSLAYGSATASIAGTFVLGGGSAQITYNCANAVTTVDGTFTNANTSGGSITNPSGTALLINGTFNHNGNGGTIPLATYANASTLNINGLTTTSATLSTGTLGNLVINCPGITSGSNLNLGILPVTINGNFTVTSTGAGSIAFGGGPTVTVNGLTTITSGEFRLSNSTSAGGTLTAIGGLTQNGGTISSATTSGTNTINVGNSGNAGNFIQTAGTITNGSSSTNGITLRLYGNFDQSAPGIITETSFGSTLIQFSKTLPGAQTVNVAGSFLNTIKYQQSNTAGIDLQSGILPVSGPDSGSFTHASSGIVSSSGGSISYTNGSTIIYSGSTNQTTGAEWPVIVSGNTDVVIANTGTAPNNRVSLTTSRSMSGTSTFTLTSGVFVLGNNDLIFGFNNPISVSSPSATKMIATNGTGQLKRTCPIGGTVVSFPVGDITGTDEYSGIDLTFSANSTERIIGVIVTDANPPSNGTAVDYLSRYWTYTDSQEGVGTYAYTSSYRYTTADINGTETSILPATWDGANWTSLTGSASVNTLLINSQTQATAQVGSRVFTGRTTPPVDYVWTGTTSTDWNDGTNWDQGTVPNATAHNVTINTGSGNMPEISSGAFTVKNLTINNAAATLAISGGSLAVTGTSTLTSGSLTTSNAATMTLTGAVTLPSGFVVTQNGTSIITSSGANTISAGATLTVNNSAAFTSSGAFSNAGSLNLNNTSTLTVNNASASFSGTNSIAAGSTITFGAALTIPVLAYGNLILSASSGTYDVAGDLTLAGNFTQSGASTFRLNNQSSGTRTLSVGGSVLLSGSSSAFQLITNSGAGNTTVNIMGNLTISGSAQIDMESTSSTTGTAIINVAGNFNSSATGTSSSGPVDFGTGTITGNAINIAGDFTKSGTGTFYTSATSTGTGFVFNKAGTQTFSYSGANSQYVQYTVNPGSTLQMLTSLTLLTATNPTSTFTVNGVLDMGLNQIISTADALFSLGSGATLKTSHATGITGSVSGFAARATYNAATNYEFTGSVAISNTNFVNATMNHLTISNTAGVTQGGAITVNGNLTIASGAAFTTSANAIGLKGNWVNNGGTLTTSNTVTLNGTSAQSYTNTGTNTFNNLTLNNANGLLLNNNLNVSSALTLTAGKVTMGANNVTTGSISGSPTAYLITDGVGQFMITPPAAATTIFPVGVSASSYDPVSVNPTNSVAFSTNVKATANAGDYTPAINNFALAGPRQWLVSATSPGLTVLTLTNGDGMYTPSMPYVIGHSNGMAWDEIPATFSANTWTATTSTFSPFGAGSEGAFSTPTGTSSSDYFRSITSGDWTTPATWESSPVSDFSSGVVSPATLAPDDNANTITIRNTHNVTISSPVTADQIVVESGGSITQNSDLNLANGAGTDLSVSGNYFWYEGILNAPGDVVIQTGGNIYLVNGTTKHLWTNLTNNGTISWSDGPIYFGNNPTITNNGTWNITGFSNYTYLETSDGVIVNNGILNRSDDAGTTNFAYLLSFTNSATGTINGVGKYIFDFGTSYTNNGVIAPGSSPGILTFDNIQPLTSSSTLQIEMLDGSGAGTGHDQLQHNYDLTLAGTLTVTETGMVPYGTYTIISVPGFIISGSFSTVNLPAGYTLQVNMSTVNLVKAAPASAASDYFRSITTGDWSIPATWESSPVSDFSSGVVSPATLTPDDNANTITIRSGHTVSINAGVTIDQTIVEAGGTLSQNTDVNLADGTGTDLDVSGNYNWNAGIMNMPGSVVIQAGGILNINNNVNHGVRASITNNGTINWNDGNLKFSNTPTITNTGTWNILGNNSLSPDYSGGTIVSSGSIIKTSVGSTDFANGINVNNSGAFTTAGTIGLQSDFTNTGSLNLNAANFTTGVAGVYYHNTGATITGTGSINNFVAIVVNANMNLPVGINVENYSDFNLAAGVTLTINGTFNFYQANLGGSGANMMVASGANFNFAGSAIKKLNCGLTNNGTITWSDGTIRYSNSPTITNNNTFNITGNNSTTQEFSSGSIVNNSTLYKSSTGPTDFSGIDNFTNSATGTIKGLGTISINGNTYTNDGVIAPGASPGILTIDGPQPFSSNSTLQIEMLNGTGPGTGHDQLQRNSSLMLAGTLTVTETGMVPVGTYTIIELTTGSISGNFSTVNLPSCYTLQVNSASVTVTKGPIVLCPDDFELCINDGPYNLSGGDPVGGTYSGTGVSSNMFDPSVAGLGPHTITYTYTSAGCTNTCTFEITVLSLPAVSFTGLASEYCIDALPVVLTGNHPGEGTFTGAGITDNFDGTASFDPSIAGAGVHNITYEYIDVNGCLNSQTQSVTVNILPLMTCPSDFNLCLSFGPYDLSALPSTPIGGTYSGDGVTGATFNTMAAGVGPHMITYSYSDMNMCSNTCTFTITVLPLPSITTGSYGPACSEDANIPLSGTPSGGTWSGTGVGGNLMAGFYFDPSAGTQTITYTATDGNGCSNSANTTITVNPSPVVTCPGNSSTCIDASTFALVGGMPIGGTYSGPGVSMNNFNPSSAGAGMHTITYSFTDGNSCTGSCTFTITVHALPIVTCPADFETCINTPPFTLSGAAPVGGSYSGDGVSGGMFDPSVAGTGFKLITYTYTDMNGCSSNCSYFIHVNGLPVVTVPSYGPVCEDAADVALTGTTPNFGVWSGTGVSGNQMTGYVFDPSVGTQTLTYTYTDGNMCSNSAQTTITVNPLPTVSCPSNSSVCFDAPAYALTGGSPIGGIYSGDGVSGGMFDPALAGAGIHTITYSFTDGNSCTGSCTFTITVHALPIVTCPADFETCINTPPFTLSGAAPVGGSYSGDGVSGGMFDPSVAGTGFKLITYTYTDMNGCSNNCSYFIHVNGLPEVTVPSYGPVCEDAADVLLTGATPNFGVWSGTGVSGNQMTGYVFDPSVGTQTLTYTYTDGNSCTDFGTTEIVVNPLPSVSCPANISVCITASVFALTGATPPGGTYSGAGVSMNNFNPATAGVGAHTITYTYMDGNNCTNTCTFTITVNPNASAGTVSGTTPLCIGETTTYTSTGDAGGTWSSTNPGVATVNPITGLVEALSAGTTDITYTLFTGCNTPVSAYQTLTVDPSANSGIIIGSSTLCIGASFTFISTGDAGGVWSSISEAIATVNPTTGLVTAVSPGVTTILYTVTAGCYGPSTSSFPLNVLQDASAGTISGTTPLCIGQTNTYMSSGDGGGFWSSTNPGVATVNPITGLVEALSAGTTDITYTLFTGCNTPVSAYQTLTVDPSANSGIIIGSSTLCIGASFTFISTGDAGGVWSSISEAIATVNPTTGLVTAVSPGVTTILYTVTAGCYGPSTSSFPLNVLQDASAGTISGTTPLCIGQTNTYMSSGDGGGFWSSTNPGVATVNPITGLVEALSAGTTDITYTLFTGCNTPMSAYQTLTISPDANAGTVSGATPLTAGTTTTYSSTGDLGGSWSSTNMGVATVHVVTGLVTAIAPGSTDITYTVSAGCNNPVSASQTLNVNASSGNVLNEDTGETFATIQAAIDDTDTQNGHTIIIPSGTYTGNMDATTKDLSFAPGNSPGCVNVIGNMTLTGGDNLNMEVNGTMVCTDYDQFNVDGTVTLGGANLVLSIGYTPLHGDQFVLIDNDLADAVSGQFAQGTSFSSGGFDFTINYTGGDGNDVVMTMCAPVINTTTATTYCTLQDAINDASTGDYIELLTNISEGLILVNKELTIDGNNFTINSTSPTYGVEVSASNVSITDLILQDAGTYGIQTGCGADFLLLSNVTVNSSGNTGISIYGSDNCSLNNITSTNNGGNGVNITNSDNTSITGITTSGNMFMTGFNAGIGIFTSGTYCLPAGVSGFTLGGVINIMESTKVYSEKANASDPITGISGATIDWAVGYTAIYRYYWPDKATAYTVVKALFDAPYNFSNTQVYVADVVTEDFYVEDNPAMDNTPPMLIQTAINFEAPGQTIFVEPGTYAEDIIVNKSLAIRGPNHMINPCSGSRVAEATVVPATAAISSGEIFHVAASNVTISGFTIDGDNTSLSSGYTSTNGADIDAAEGITVYETGINGLTVTNNIIQNLSYFGVTLYDYPAGVASSGHTISDNKIQDMGTYDTGSGIDLWGGGVLLYNNQYAAVTNNCMDNVRIGIQTGNYYTANPGSNTYQNLSGNSIAARRRGIFHNLAYSSASAFTLSGNTITGVADVNETASWDGILLSSMTVASTSSGNMINGSGITSIPKTGVSVWNCQTAPLVSGGTITGVDLGINVNNFEGYPSAGSNAGNTSATIDGVNVTNAAIAGIRVNDNILNTNNATVYAEIKGNTSVSGSPTGILVSGSDATGNVHHNILSINGNAIGIDVDGGTAMINNNHIYDNGIGIRFTNGGSGNANTNNFYDASANGTDIQLTITAGGVTATPNNWFAGSTYGVENLSPITVDATLCYWNDPSGPGLAGPGSGADVTTNVSYCPWLGDEPVAFGGTGLPVSSPSVVIDITEMSGTTNDDGNICAGASVLLDATTSSAIAYAWSGGQTTASINVAPAMTTMYTVTVTFAGCSEIVSVTITVDPIPVVSGPSSVCEGSTIQMLPSGPGLGTWMSSNNAIATIDNSGLVTGVSPGMVTFTFTSNAGCSATSSTVQVKPIPVATISTPATVAAGTPMLPANIPDAGGGATYVWAITNGTITSGQGTSSILYTAGSTPSLTINVTVTNSVGCTVTGSATVNVIAAAASSFAWVPDDGPHGSCPGATNCCTDVICYGLEYTPGVSGTLTSYTTGFTANCLGGATPIVSNQSCVMSDNSFEINECMTINTVLFNSSGNAGFLPVMAGVPVITHKVCFSLSAGESITIAEDVITDLTASIDLTGGGQYSDFPLYTTTTLSKPLWTAPLAGSSTVGCPAQALVPTPPAVLDYCGNPVTATLNTTVNVPDPILCEGMRTYTFTYTDCAGYSQPWSYTYTIDHTIAPAEVGGPVSVSGGTVECVASATAPLTLPVVQDQCGNILSPAGPPAIGGTYVDCEGTYTYTYSYVDCSGLPFTWTYTYMIDHTTAPSEFGGPVSASGGSIECAASATAPMTLPVVKDVCGNTLSPTGPPTIGGTYAGCEGTYTYTYDYVDCSGLPYAWTYTYVIDHITAPGEVGGPVSTIGGTVECVASATAPINLPVVKDVCGNTLSPTGAPTIGGTYLGCEGTYTYTYNYVDCSGLPYTWTYTYIIDHVTPPSESSGPVSTNGGIVECAASATAPFVLPLVTDVCGNPLSPSGPPIIGGTYAGCEGTYTYTYNYVDCSGLPFTWTYTYMIDHTTAPGEVGGPVPTSGGTVECIASATAPMTLPVVKDVCGNTLAPAGPPSIGGTYAGCEGTYTYTYSYADCSGLPFTWTYTYMIDRTTAPAEDGVPVSISGGTVECASSATAPMALPVVKDVCGNTLAPTGPPAVGGSYAGCEGTYTYTYNYVDCSGLPFSWTYTYMIDHITAPSESSGPVPTSGGTVECLASATAPLVLPLVTDVCGNPLSPSGPPVIGGTYAGCEGTYTYTYNYVDCSGLPFAWTYTYMIDHISAPTEIGGPVAVNGGTVACLASATAPVILPVVQDVCGNILLPSGAPANGGTYDGCEGTYTYVYSYADCSGLPFTWTYTYTIERLPFTVPVAGGSTVNCPLSTNTVPAPPVVVDNCGQTLTPSGPVASAIPGCGGIRTYTWTYTDCEGNTLNWVYTYTVVCDPVTLRVFLEGPYDVSTDLMIPQLNIDHVLPGQDKLLSPNPSVQLAAPFTPFGQPYSVAPWNYTGNMGMNFGDPSAPGAPMGVTPYPADVVDWVLVTVRENGILPVNNIWTCAGWLHTDGEVTFPEPCASLTFNPMDEYFALVEHRNHLAVLDTVDMSCSGYIIDWNFTTENSYKPLFRYGQKEMEPGVWAMHAANGEQVTSRAAISSPDRTTWRLLQNTLGYSIGDYNMNTSTNSGDETIWKINQNRTSGIIFQ